MHFHVFEEAFLGEECIFGVQQLQYPSIHYLQDPPTLPQVQGLSIISPGTLGVWLQRTRSSTGYPRSSVSAKMFSRQWCSIDLSIGISSKSTRFLSKTRQVWINGKTGITGHLTRARHRVQMDPSLSSYITAVCVLPTPARCCKIGTVYRTK